jgi:pSer/pThr/pTyr-binding forkhead associated (FHA) protein
MLKLTIEDDEGKTTVIPVIRDEVTIGRQEGNTIRLTERNVSRRHARLVRQNGALYIEDLSSFTGVKLNGTKISALTQVKEGDQLQIGDYKMALRPDQPATQPATDVPDRATMPSLPVVVAGASVPGAPAASAARSPTPAPTSSAKGAAAQPASAEEIGPDPFEGQPTIPLRTLSDQGLAPAEGPEVVRSARVVVVSTELAGMEFSLNRSSVVIGRTDENDVVLNHRSISRHHAKIVRDNDRFTIVDLQSANGVRVNGEDYERIELHPGDVLELGHVKLRFVGPLEQFTFDPASVRVPRRLPLKLGFVVGGLSLAAGVALLIQNLVGPRANEAAAPVVAAAPAPVAAPAPSPPPPPGPPAEAVPAATPEPLSPEEVLAQAVLDARNEDWEAAATALEPLAGKRGPDDPILNPATRRQIVDLRRKVETERVGAKAFAAFDEASQAKNYGDALDRFGDIPNESIYKKRARPRYDEARSLFLAEHLTLAERYRSQGKCPEVKHETDQIARVDPRNQLAKEMLKLCRPRAESGVAVAMAGAPRPEKVAPERVVARAERPLRAAKVTASASAPRAEVVSAKASAAAAAQAPAASAADPEPDPDALMKQAREAWLHQQCGVAIDISRKALRAKPGMTDAYQIIAVCSCSLKDAEGATRAYLKLEDKSRSLVRSLCQKHGIALAAE